MSPRQENLSRHTHSSNYRETVSKTEASISKKEEINLIEGYSIAPQTFVFIIIRFVLFFFHPPSNSLFARTTMARTRCDSSLGYGFYCWRQSIRDLWLLPSPTAESTEAGPCSLTLTVLETLLLEGAEWKRTERPLRHYTLARGGKKFIERK